MKDRSIQFLLYLVFYGQVINLNAQIPEVVVQSGHSGPVKALAFSPDGYFILSGGTDNSAILWDLRGHEIQRFDGHRSEVTAVAFAPDGRHILTGSADGIVKLWNLHGQELQIFKGHEFVIRSVAFSSDGQRIFTKGDRYVKAWNIQGKELQTLAKHPGVSPFSVSPNGNYLLTGGNDGVVKLWDMSGHVVQNFKGHQGPIISLDFSPDGQYILTGSMDKQVKLWNLHGEELRNFAGYSRVVSSVAFTQDGKTVLTAGDDVVKSWNLEGKELYSFKAHSDAVIALACSPDGNFLLTSGSIFDEAIKLWNFHGRELYRLTGYAQSFSSVDISPNGRYALLSTMAQARIVDLWTYDVQSLVGHSHLVYAAYFSKDGQYILTGSADKTAKLWDLSGKQLSSFSGHSDYIRTVAWSPEGKSFLTGSDDNTAILWSIEGEKLKTFIGHEDDVTAVAFSPDGDLLATGDLGGVVKFWDRAGRELQSFSDQYGPIASIDFSSDGQHLVAGSWDGTIKLWRTDRTELLTIEAHDSTIDDVAFSPGHKHIISGDYEGITKLWNLNGELVQVYKTHNSAIKSLDFSPDGQYILSGSYDSTAKLWEVKTGNTLLIFFSFAPTDNIFAGESPWIKINPEQYYMGSQSLPKFIHFQLGLQAYTFDQFDLRLNRPDKVLETLLPFGADSTIMIQYRQAYYKRLEKYGFTEEMLSDDYHVPECAISNTSQLPITTTDGVLALQIEAHDTIHSLDRLNLYVNDVPIYGIQGIDLRNKNTREYTTKLNIPLSRGPNKIQVSALNQGGAESLKATTYITYDAPETKPNLYLITIGVSDYQAEGKDLQYAAKDARDIADWYKSAQSFGQVYTRTLTDAQATKTNILALRQWLEGTSVDDQVLLFVSGHGLLDANYDFYYATHDIDFTHPAEKGILYDEIEGLLDGIPARKKLLLMDACHSGEYDKDTPPLTEAQRDSLEKKGVTFKGFAKGKPILGLQNSFEMMQQLFVDLRRGSGSTVITSSSGLQVSYEDEEWANGAFTYAFLYGLKTMKADADQDGQVTASEIQVYVGEFVPRLTEGLQVPTFRRENLEFDFRVW